MLKFFHAPGSCSQASLIALEEAGAEFETVVVDLRSGEQDKPEYRKINPKGRVPALATDYGVLTENPAILSYIAMRYPEAKLAPQDDPFQFAKMQSFNAFLASTVQPSLGPLARPERYTDDVSARPALAAKAMQNAAMYLRLIEKDLLAGPWVLGDTYSVSDGYLLTFSSALERLNLPSDEFPKLIAHRDRMNARPAVAKAVSVA